MAFNCLFFQPSNSLHRKLKTKLENIHYSLYVITFLILGMQLCMYCDSFTMEKIKDRFRPEASLLHIAGGLALL